MKSSCGTRKAKSRFPVGAALLIALLFSASSAPASLFPSKFDDVIRRSARVWMPTVPWRMWKAQLYQESRLVPTAVSPVGARGLAQIMPGTWGDIAPELDLDTVDPFDPAASVLAGAFYMARLRRAWSSPRPELDRHELAEASYNAGFGNLLKAQRACGGPNEYEAIVICLVHITGKHSRETVTYVQQIRRWFFAMS